MINIINKHRLFTSLVIIFLGIIISDVMFHYFYPQIISLIEYLFGLGKESHDAVDLTFAPEIWGGVLATVLGTLIIVIAIAACKLRGISYLTHTVSTVSVHMQSANGK